MRHLFAVRSFLSVLTCSLLCSCVIYRAPAPTEEGAVESLLDSGPSGIVCDGTRLVGSTSFSETCLPTETGPGPTVSGLEPLAAPLRECVLESLPVETGAGAPTECLKGAA